MKPTWTFTDERSVCVNSDTGCLTGGNCISSGGGRGDIFKHLLSKKCGRNSLVTALWQQKHFIWMHPAVTMKTLNN